MIQVPQGVYTVLFWGPIAVAVYLLWRVSSMRRQESGWQGFIGWPPLEADKFEAKGQGLLRALKVWLAVTLIVVPLVLLLLAPEQAAT